MNANNINYNEFCLMTIENMGLKLEEYYISRLFIKIK